MTKIKDIRLLAVWLLVMASLVAVALLNGSDLFGVKTNLMQLLPSVDRQPVVERAREQQAKKVERRLLFLVAADSAKQATDIGVQLQQSLRSASGLTLLDQQHLQQQSQQYYRHLYPYRYQLLTGDIRARLNSNPQQFVQSATELLYSPTAFARASSLEHDPLYLFGGYFEQLFPSLMAVESGVLLSASGGKHHGLVIAQVQRNAFDLHQQEQLLALTDQLRADVSAAGAELYVTGLPLYAASGARSAQREIRLVGAGSLLGIVLLLIATFSALRPLLLALTAIAVGVGAAWVLSGLLFGHLHILTLVFGASLVGVAVDYCLHYFCCHLREGSGEMAPRQTADRRRQVVRSMTLAMITSAVAYLSMASAPFPGLRQMAVFSATGLAFAWLTVVTLFPLVLRGHHWPQRQSLLSVVGGMAAHWSKCVIRYRWLAVLVFLAVVAGVTQLRSEDDVRQLQTPDPQLQMQEHYLKAVLPEMADSRFLLVSGSTGAEVLQRENHLTGQLDQLQRQGSIAGYRAVSQILPSAGQQRVNYQLLRNNLYDNGMVRRYLEALGFSDEGIEREYLSFRQARENSLSPDSALNSAPEPWGGLWLPCDDNGCGSVVRLLGVSDVSALEPLHRLPGVDVVDTVSETSQVMSRYRGRASQLLVFGILAATVLLGFWLGIARALLAVAVPVVAIAIALGVLGWLGEPLNLFRVFALLLVLGIGADFGIFAVRQRGFASHTALAISLSAVTTLLAFGLLSVSDTAAVRSFGQTLLIGITAALLLAPVAARVPVAVKK